MAEFNTLMRDTLDWQLATRALSTGRRKVPDGH